MLLICPRNTIKISQKLSNNKYTTSRPSNAHSVVTTVHRRMRSLRVLCTATNQLQQNFEKVTNLPCKVGISVYKVWTTEMPYSCYYNSYSRFYWTLYRNNNVKFISMLQNRSIFLQINVIVIHYEFEAIFFINNWFISKMCASTCLRQSWKRSIDCRGMHRKMKVHWKLQHGYIYIRNRYTYY